MPRTFLSLMLAALLFSACARAPREKASSASAPVPAPAFTWRCVGAWSLRPKTRDEALARVRSLRALGFNAMLLYPCNGALWSREVVDEARALGMKMYPVVNPVYGEWGWETAPGVPAPDTKNAPQLLQSYSAEETEALNTPADPDRVAYKGPWLCIDQSEARAYAAKLAVARVAELNPTGVCLDFIGYKNYRGCQCAESCRQRSVKQKTAIPLDPGNFVSPEDLVASHSLAMIHLLYAETRETLRKNAPDAELICHIYPPFDPDPYYGATLPVDYPAETVSWYFTPHWSLDRIRENCQAILARAAAVQAARGKPGETTPTAFLGLQQDEKHGRTAAQLRAELRAIGESGIRALMIAGPGKFLDDEALCAVLREELGE